MRPDRPVPGAPRRVLVVGIGAGDPEHLTLAALRAIDALDVLLLVTKDPGTDELVAVRRAVVAAHRTTGPFREVVLPDPPRPWRTTPDYPAAVDRWRAARTARWTAALRDELAPGETGAFLVWGDPSVYESTLAVLHAIREQDGEVPGLDLEVIPGVSSIHALTARHRIPLNRVGGAVHITPARRLARRGLPPDADDVVVVLDPDTTFTTLEPEGLDIFWGAYLGTPDEILIAGPLAEVADSIVTARAAAKARKGWVFDTYLLRRRDPAT